MDLQPQFGIINPVPEALMLIRRLQNQRLSAAFIGIEIGASQLLDIVSQCKESLKSVHVNVFVSQTDLASETVKRLNPRIIQEIHLQFLFDSVALVNALTELAADGLPALRSLHLERFNNFPLRKLLAVISNKCGALESLRIHGFTADKDLTAEDFAMIAKGSKNTIKHVSLNIGPQFNALLFPAALFASPGDFSSVQQRCIEIFGVSLQNYDIDRTSLWSFAVNSNLGSFEELDPLLQLCCAPPSLHSEIVLVANLRVGRFDQSSAHLKWGIAKAEKWLKGPKVESWARLISNLFEAARTKFVQQMEKILNLAKSFAELAPLNFRALMCENESQLLLYLFRDNAWVTAQNFQFSLPELKLFAPQALDLALTLPNVEFPSNPDLNFVVPILLRCNFSTVKKLLKFFAAASDAQQELFQHSLVSSGDEGVKRIFQDAGLTLALARAVGPGGWGVCFHPDLTVSEILAGILHFVQLHHQYYNSIGKVEKSDTCEKRVQRVLEEALRSVCRVIREPFQVAITRIERACPGFGRWLKKFVAESPKETLQQVFQQQDPKKLADLVELDDSL